MEYLEQVSEYIDSFDGVVKDYLVQLRSLIHETVPNGEELINYNIPAFSLVIGGKREQQIMIAGYKNHVGFYPHPTTIEKFWDQLNVYKKAKGSVQFPLDKPLPKPLIIEMIKFRLQLINKD